MKHKNHPFNFLLFSMKNWFGSFSRFLTQTQSFNFVLNEFELKLSIFQLPNVICKSAWLANHRIGMLGIAFCRPIELCIETQHGQVQRNVGRVFNFRNALLYSAHFMLSIKVKNSAQTTSRFSPVTS